MKSRLFVVALVALLAVAPLAAAHPAEAGAHRLMAQPAPDWAGVREAFFEAAQAGSPTAMAHLGWIHEMGHGVEVSHPLAVIWYTRAVEAGGDGLALKLGWLHVGGDAAVRDRALAERWFRRAIDHGDLNANVALASVLIADAMGGQSPERVDEARALLEPALDGGLILASYFLARLYLEGIGAQAIDYDRALPYVRLGSDHGHPQMQGWLARMYAEGNGVPSDPMAAAMWALLAASGDDPMGRQMTIHYESALSAPEFAEVRRRAEAWSARQGGD